MDEYFLQFIWNFQKFKTHQLQLTSGEPLSVYKQGFQNHHSGPDFLEAKLKIGELIWSGAVEVHHRSSDWLIHKHDTDEAYQSVVLHVVWSHDREIYLKNQPIPTLELSAIVAENLYTEYRRYINQPGVILCSGKLPEISPLKISSMLDRAFSARLKQKGKVVLKILEDANDSWDETAYRVLGKNFGFKTNAEPFERLTKSLPYSILRKHLEHPMQVEALLFGMAGLLEEPMDQYSADLRKEFDFLSKKYDLKPVLARHLWKFSRLRPANFPTVRLAQFSTILIHQKHLFQELTTIENLRQAEQMLSHDLAAYWRKSYDFGKPSRFVRKLGKTSVENLIINSIGPLLTAYSKYIDDVSYIEKAVSLVSELKPENNYIIREWSAHGIKPENAADSQGLIYQYESFCRQKKCLRCNIGISMLNP